MSVILGLDRLPGGRSRAPRPNPGRPNTRRRGKRAAGSFLRPSPRPAGAVKRPECRPARRLPRDADRRALVRSRRSAAWRRYALALQLRGFPLPAGVGRPLAPEEGDSKGRMRAFGAIRSESIKFQCSSLPTCFCAYSGSPSWAISVSCASRKSMCFSSSVVSSSNRFIVTRSLTLSQYFAASR